MRNEPYLLRTITQQYTKDREDTPSMEKRKEKERKKKTKKESTNKEIGRKPCTRTNVKAAFSFAAVQY